MRLCSYDDGSGPQVGFLFGEEIVPGQVIDVPIDQARALLEECTREDLQVLGEAAARCHDRILVSEVRLVAPVPDPQKIICLGLNYRDHAAESGLEPPAAPLWFAKFANSLRGTGEDVVLPKVAPDRVDYEAELAVVIGRQARRVSPERALEYLAGAMPFNDISARDLQMENQLWLRGKAIDGFAPCGPAIVSMDEIDDLQALTLRTRINGEIVQEGNTAEQIFGVAEVISFLSQTMTLVPGDIIATGTPAGVGASKRRWLAPGEVVEVEVEGLGAVSSRLVAEEELD